MSAIENRGPLTKALHTVSLQVTFVKGLESALTP